MTDADKTLEARAREAAKDFQNDERITLYSSRQPHGRDLLAALLVSFARSEGERRYREGLEKAGEIVSQVAQSKEQYGFGMEIDIRIRRLLRAIAEPRKEGEA